MVFPCSNGEEVPTPGERNVEVFDVSALQSAARAFSHERGAIEVRTDDAGKLLCIVDSDDLAWYGEEIEEWVWEAYRKRDDVVRAFRAKAAEDWLAAHPELVPSP